MQIKIILLLNLGDETNEIRTSKKKIYSCLEFSLVLKLLRRSNLQLLQIDRQTVGSSIPIIDCELFWNELESAKEFPF